MVYEQKCRADGHPYGLASRELFVTTARNLPRKSLICCRPRSVGYSLTPDTPGLASEGAGVRTMRREPWGESRRPAAAAVGRQHLSDRMS
jgi:hypothetical protein